MGSKGEDCEAERESFPLPPFRFGFLPFCLRGKRRERRERGRETERERERERERLKQTDGMRTIKTTSTMSAAHTATVTSSARKTVRCSVRSRAMGGVGSAGRVRAKTVERRYASVGDGEEPPGGTGADGGCARSEGCCE